MADRKPITQISNGKVTPPKRIVTKSESGEYKYIQKSDSGKAKRTLKGVLTGADNIKKVKSNFASETEKTLQKRNELSKMKADQETINKVKPFKTYKSYVLEQKSSKKKKS
jgi:hypothetical protein